MIGSGTESDPWVPLTAAELKDCWSNRGGYIDLTCDIDMGIFILGDPSSSKTIFNLNGFSLYIRQKYSGQFLFSKADRFSVIRNGVIFFIPDIDDKISYINFGDLGSIVSDLVLVNESSYNVNVSYRSNGDRNNIVCINKKTNMTSIDRYACVYQSALNGSLFFKIGEALPEHIYNSKLPTDVFYIDGYLGGCNLRIEKTGKSFISGVTHDNGNPVKMELTVVGVKSSAKWSGYSGEDGAFTINLGSYSAPISVFAYDIINKKLRSNNAYLVGDVAITSPDAGVKFTCVTAGVTTELPNPLPSAGTITIGTAVFEVKKISPSSCAGPMIPANKYSNYGIKSK